MKPVNQQRHAYVADKTLAVLAVKESPKAAIEAAQRMGRRRGERLLCGLATYGFALVLSCQSNRFYASLDKPEPFVEWNTWTTEYRFLFRLRAA